MRGRGDERADADRRRVFTTPRRVDGGSEKVPVRSRRRAAEAFSERRGSERRLGRAAGKRQGAQGRQGEK